MLLNHKDLDFVDHNECCSFIVSEDTINDEDDDYDEDNDDDDA